MANIGHTGLFSTFGPFEPVLSNCRPPMCLIQTTHLENFPSRGTRTKDVVGEGGGRGDEEGGNGYRRVIFS